MKYHPVSARRESSATRNLLLVLATLAVAVVVGCKDTAPTTGVQTVAFKPKAICDIYGIHAPPCVCFDNPTLEMCQPPPPAPPVSGDSARVFCWPHRLIRGMRASCKIYIAKPYAFHVTIRNATDIGGRNAAHFTVSGGPDSNHVAGDIAQWIGPIVLSTHIRIDVTEIDAAGHSKPLPSVFESISVDARQIAEYQVQQPAEHDTLIYPFITPYPKVLTVINGVPQTLGATYGVFFTDTAWINQLQYPDTSHISTVSAGPNQGLTWFATLPEIVDATRAYIHPALLGGLGIPKSTFWYSQQDGSQFYMRFPPAPPAPDSAIVTACDANGVSNLYSESRRHEGVTGDPASHYSVLNTQLAAAGMKAAAESTVVQGNVFSVALLTQLRLKSFLLTYTPVDSLFDWQDRRRIFGDLSQRTVGSIGCFIRYALDSTDIVNIKR